MINQRYKKKNMMPTSGTFIFYEPMKQHQQINNRSQDKKNDSLESGKVELLE